MTPANLILCHAGGSNGVNSRPSLMVTLTLTLTALGSVQTDQSICPYSPLSEIQSTSSIPHCICWVRSNICSPILPPAPLEQLAIKFLIAFPSPHGSSCSIYVPTLVLPPPACPHHHTLQSPSPTLPPPTSSTAHLQSHAPSSASAETTLSPSSHLANDRNHNSSDRLAPIRYFRWKNLLYLAHI